ncbi:MAG: hypothetical protein RTU63_08400 [Candidatus Thorarchaeota archaeon]
MNKINGKLKVVLIVFGFLLMLQAVPMIQPMHVDAVTTHPGVNGAPPVIEVLEDATYYQTIGITEIVVAGITLPVPCISLITETGFNEELSLNGPVLDEILYPPDYVVSDSLVFEKVGLYVPVFLLEREQWYSHEINLRTSVSESLTFKIKGGFNFAKGPVSIGVSGSYETSTTATTASGWGLNFDDSFGKAESLTIYLYMEFLRVSGSVNYWDGSEIEYDAVILETIDFDDLQYATDALERPEIDASAMLDKDNDGPDYYTAMTDYREFTYKETKDVTWGLGFKLKLGPKVFNFACEGSFECSTETSMTINHRFESYWADDDYFNDSRLPESVNGFWINTGNFFSVNLKMDHALGCMPTTPDIDVPYSIDAGQSYEFSAQSIDPVGHDLYYTFYWGDGQKTVTDYVGSGERVSLSHTYAERGPATLIVVVRNYYGDTNEDIVFMDILALKPDTPAKPAGPASGIMDFAYNFDFVTNDDHNFDVRYEIDWGDGSVEMTGDYASGETVSISHTWTTGSVNGIIYSVKARAQNLGNGLWSDWSSSATIIIRRSIPNVPSIGGPDSLLVDTSGSFWARAYDPAGLQVRYTFHWSDGSSWTSAWVDSGTKVTKSHSFSSIGTKGFWVDVTNTHSMTSTADPMLFSVYNNAPNSPARPSGPTTGYTGSYYTFSFRTTDPEGHNVRYQISWGDGTTTTTGYYSSGSTVYRSHSWRTSVYGGMYYYVKVRAQDSLGAWSSWSSSKAILIKPSSSGGGPILMSANPLAGAQLDVGSVGISEQILPIIETVNSSGNTTSDLEALFPRIR